MYIYEVFKSVKSAVHGLSIISKSIVFLASGIDVDNVL